MDQTRFDNAIALRDSGRTDDAIREFRLMAADAGDANEKASLLCNEVSCYCGLWRLRDADTTLAQIRDIAPDDPKVRVCVDFLAAGLAAQQEGLEKALVQYEWILREYVGLLKTREYHDLFEDTQQRRAFVLVRLERYAEALPLLKEATSFETLNAEDQQETHLYLGICYMELRKSDPAKREFLRAIEFGLKNDTEASARYRLGLLCFADSAFAQAKYQLEAILQNHQDEIQGLPRNYVYEQLSRACRYLGEEELARRYMQMAREAERISR